MVVFAVAALMGVRAGAQSAAHYPLYAFLDIPQQGVEAVPPSVQFHGWALNCETGDAVNGITLWRRNVATGAIVQVLALRLYVERPDVRDAYWYSCGGRVTRATGFALVPIEPQPPGTYDFGLQFIDTPNAQHGLSINRRLTVGGGAQ